MESAPLRQTPPLLHNRYRITSKLGTSRLAVVYRATDERLQRTVLVHLLRPEHQEQQALHERFLDEARRRARRPHPALLEVYDSGEVGRRPYLITEDVQAKPLREALPLPPHEAMRVLRQVVGAAIACHESGVPIPPITSSTVLISSESRPVLVDPWWLPSEMLMLEMAHYRAPERTLGQPPGPATPVYSLGILAYELFSGSRPFKGTTPKSIAEQHVTQPPPPALQALRGFTPRLAQVLNAATARRPEDRLTDLVSLQRELAAVEAQSDSPTQPLAVPQRPLRQAMRESLRPVTGVLRRTGEQRPPPPPPQVWRPPPPPHVAIPQPRPIDVRREVRRELRQERRRDGCRRTSSRLAVRLAVVAALLAAIFYGYNYSLNWYEGGGARNVCSGSLPAFVCERIPGGTAGGVYVVKSDLNLRSSPEIDPANIVGVLSAGTRVVQTGGPQSSESITWLPVRAIDGQEIEGWVSFDYLRRAE